MEFYQRWLLRAVVVIATLYLLFPATHPPKPRRHVECPSEPLATVLLVTSRRYPYVSRTIEHLLEVFPCFPVVVGDQAWNKILYDKASQHRSFHDSYTSDVFEAMISNISTPYTIVVSDDQLPTLNVDISEQMLRLDHALVDVVAGVHGEDFGTMLSVRDVHGSRVELIPSASRRLLEGVPDCALVDWASPSFVARTRTLKELKWPLRNRERHRFDAYAAFRDAKLNVMACRDFTLESIETTPPDTPWDVPLVCDYFGVDALVFPNGTAATRSGSLFTPIAATVAAEEAEAYRARAVALLNAGVREREHVQLASHQPAEAVTTRPIGSWGELVRAPLLLTPRFNATKTATPRTVQFAAPTREFLATDEALEFLHLGGAAASSAPRTLHVVMVALHEANDIVVKTLYHLEDLATRGDGLDMHVIIAELDQYERVVFDRNHFFPFNFDLLQPARRRSYLTTVSHAAQRVRQTTDARSGNHHIIVVVAPGAEITAGVLRDAVRCVVPGVIACAPMGVHRDGRPAPGVYPVIAFEAQDLSLCEYGTIYANREFALVERLVELGLIVNRPFDDRIWAPIPYPKTVVLPQRHVHSAYQYPALPFASGTVASRVQLNLVQRYVATVCTEESALVERSTALAHRSRAIFCVTMKERHDTMEDPKLAWCSGGGVTIYSTTKDTLMID